MTPDLGRLCAVDAARLANERNIKKFLFDVRKAPNLQSVTEDYTYAYKEMDRFGFSRTMRSALLVSPDDRSHDFIVTAFQNAGYMIEHFTDEGSAISWLEKEESAE
jgi:hypothetical protein